VRVDTFHAEAKLPIARTTDMTGDASVLMGLHKYTRLNIKLDCTPGDDSAGQSSCCVGNGALTAMHVQA
jgi:hypothetical protein